MLVMEVLKPWWCRLGVLCTAHIQQPIQSATDLQMAATAIDAAVNSSSSGREPSSSGGAEASTSGSSSSDDSSGRQALGSAGRGLVMVFTCSKCDTRSAKSFSRRAYDHGLVLVRCPGCDSQHLVAGA